MTTAPGDRIPFGVRLSAALSARGPLCAGIDPHPGLLDAWGLTDDVDGLARFTDVCVEAFAGRVALVKPQVAFYEAYGSRGLAVLERALASLREADTLVLADAKRGDIGSTMTAYARAWLSDDSPLVSDAVTVSPFLGVGSLAPALDEAQRTGRGVFVLSATSNPEGASVQWAVGEDGRPLAQAVVDSLAPRNASGGTDTLGSFGVVVGATVSRAPDLAGLGGPVLMPGVGAQGGTADDVRRVAAGRLDAVVPNLSRDLLRHGPDVGALVEAVDRAVEDFAFLRA